MYIFSCNLLHTGLLLGLFFDIEAGGDIFLRNIDLFSTDYTALYLRRQISSKPPVPEPHILHRNYIDQKRDNLLFTEDSAPRS
jgi:hypothetical protein